MGSRLDREGYARGIARMRSENTVNDRPEPDVTGRLARTALLVVLIVLTLGHSIADSSSDMPSCGPAYAPSLRLTTTGVFP